jgi:hypothetical protein
MSSRFSPVARRLGAFSLLVAGCLALAGCKGGELPAAVSGKVSYQGKPVTSGVVVLVGADGKASTTGAVGPDGTYCIAQAPAGTVRVAFDNPPPQRVAPGDPEARDAAQAAARYVPTPLQYRDAAQSGLTLELKRGTNPNRDIELK